MESKVTHVSDSKDQLIQSTYNPYFPYQVYIFLVFKKYIRIKTKSQEHNHVKETMIKLR